MDKALVLVAILACGSSTPREHTPKPDDAAVPLDASLDASIDASPRDAAVDAPVAIQRPSPPSLVFPIISIEESEGGSRIAIRAGSKQGVRDGWRAVLIGDDDRPVEDGDLVIKQIGQDTTRAWSRLHVAVVKAKYRRVRFEPR